MLKILHIRVALKETYTEGVFVDEGMNMLLCDVLEDKVREEKIGSWEGDDKVYGETAIPYGEYDIEVTYSPRFKKDMVLVKGVPDFTGVRLHWGRTAANSHGCPLVGVKDGNGALKNSGMTDNLVKLLLSHGNKGKLRII